MLPKVILSIFIFHLLLMCISCGKDHTDPPPANTDSLTTGWSVAKAPSQNAIVDIAFADDATGYAVNSAHNVWKSTDGGFSWSLIVQLPDSFYMSNVAVTKDGKVFIAPNSSNTVHGIYKSVDGIHFTYQYVGPIQIGHSGDADVVFSSNDTGYISGASSQPQAANANGLWQTTDGGITWHFVSVGSFGNTWHNMAFYNSSGYVTNNTTLYYTAGRQNRWDSTASFPSVVESVSAVSPLIAYAAVHGGLIYKTVNGGADFEKVGSVPVSGGYFSIRFSDEMNGMVSSGHYLFQTTDGGGSWTTKANPATVSFTEIYTLDATHSWVACDYGTILVYNP